jgi:hypothetical protein
VSISRVSVRGNVRDGLSYQISDGNRNLTFMILYVSK